MDEPTSSSSPPMDTVQHSGAQHTTLPAEIWVNIFGQVSRSPDHSLAPLAAVCRGWQREVEKLTFAEIVVQPTTDDIAILRRILEDDRRANILSKITFRGLSELAVQAFHLSEEPDILNLTAHKICQFFLCLGSTARESSYAPLTLAFDGWDDPHGLPPNTLPDCDIVERTLGAYSPSDIRIKHMVLPLERQLWPSSMFADMVRFCSPELKKIDLGLISVDNDEADYNTCFMRALQKALNNANLEELNAVYPSSVFHQETDPLSYRYTIASFVRISRKVKVFKVKDLAADLFFDLASRGDWRDLETLEIDSMTLGGAVTTFFQDENLKNAVKLVTTVSNAVSRMKQIKRLVVKQRLWLYFDDTWDMERWAWLEMDFSVDETQLRTRGTTAKLSIRGVEPEPEAIEAWQSAVSKERDIPLECDVGLNPHQMDSHMRMVMGVDVD